MFAAVVASPHVSAAPQFHNPLDPAVTVQFGELNTATAEGTRVLYDRLSAAAHAVCDAGVHWYPKAYFEQRECYRATLDRVVARLNLPLLTALHAKSQRPPDVPSLQAGNR
jgi:UrcA family protein